MTMRVFKMNDYEHVAANSPEEAKKFYGELCGFTYDEVQADFEGEASLQEKMLVDVNDLTNGMFVNLDNLVYKYGTAWIPMTFEWVLENDQHNNEPFVISSTEY